MVKTKAFGRLVHLAAGVAILALPASIPLVLTTHSASSQARSIKLINPFPPGGTADVVARIVTEQISRTRGVTFVIENRPGAATMIGTESVARATPDGNTLLINSTSFVITPHLRKLNFDPLASFAPICNLTQSPQLLFVNNDSPHHTMGNLIAAARAKPGELTLASTPAGSAQISFERFKRAADLSITYVPFPGNAPTVNAVLGGHVTAGLANYADLLGHIQAGKLRAVATMTPARVETLPNLPTVGEAGYKEFEYLGWFGVVAPGKTPEQKLEQLMEWFTMALQDSVVKAKLTAQGLFPLKECGAEFSATLRREYEDYGRAIRDANIKAE